MLFNEKLYEFEIDGRKCSFSTGKFALRSQNSIFARMGDTVISVNVNSNPSSGDLDYFPLSVEYIERFYASGKISGSRFVKRERFPSDEAILKSRMIDRSIRSRFPSDYMDEVSVIVSVMSYDDENDPVLLAINAVSTALVMSKIPFNGPVVGMNIGLEDPIYKSMGQVSDEDPMNYVVAGDGEVFTMIDGGCNDIEDEKVVEAMRKGLEYMKPWVEAQNKFVELVGGSQEKEYIPHVLPEDLLENLKKFLGKRIEENLKAAKRSIHEETMKEVFVEFEGKYSKRELSEGYDKLQKKDLRRIVNEENVRVDGRAIDEIREMDTQIDLLPRVHGSGLFTRGVTQVLSIVTLGTLDDAQLVDDMLGENKKRYMHFYNDLPFVYGEAGRVRLLPSRRGIGHGMLAERSLVPVLPSIEDFPYTIIVVSEVQGENGSSSMASACGSSLALMAAGVPIKKTVGGIACGLVTKDDGTFQVLTDMKGVEDFYGDMDFKVIGTKDGVTAVQMDNKIEGLNMEIVEAAFKKCKEARIKVIDKIEEAISKPRPEVSAQAPQVTSTQIPVDKIGELIGPGGKNIKELTEKSGAEISIEDDGTVNIYADNKEKLEIAMSYISRYNFIPKEGQIYEGKVASVMPYGAFVDINPGVSGLVHVSEMADEFVKDVNSIVKEGDIVKVKLLEIARDGKIKLSMKQAK
ncbi:TPA: polyribonucleotide nucleotidyltransferase [Patescibacteria group bacterium]|nr:polyribonucleotide nucleotidyltransferase [Patescibacteria group bacterium]